jgi:uncharacterized protein YukE
VVAVPESRIEQLDRTLNPFRYGDGGQGTLLPTYDPIVSQPPPLTGPDPRNAGIVTMGSPATATAAGVVVDPTELRAAADGCRKAAERMVKANEAMEPDSRAVYKQCEGFASANAIGNVGESWARRVHEISREYDTSGEGLDTMAANYRSTETAVGQAYKPLGA